MMEQNILRPDRGTDLQDRRIDSSTTAIRKVLKSNRIPRKRKVTIHNYV